MTILKSSIPLANNVAASDQNQHAFVYLNTIGKNPIYLNKYKQTNIAETIKLIGEGEYNLDVLKEISVTDDYLGLDPAIRGCQNEEPIDNCTTRKYHNTILGDCGCLPVRMRLSNKVF